MAKEDGIKMDGKVVEVLPDAKFRITIENGSTILGYTSGKMKQNDIKILLGDTVTVEFSCYDLLKGRIIRRM